MYERSVGIAATGKGSTNALEFTWKATKANDGTKSSERNEQPSIFTLTAMKYRDAGVDRKWGVGASERISAN